MIIYKATNIINNKVYIGQTVRNLNQRIKEHERKSQTDLDTKFSRAINKYGFNNFTWDFLENTNNKKDLDSLEIKYIIEYNSINKGYNTHTGGTGGYNKNAVEANKKRAGKKWEEIYSEKGLETMRETVSKTYENNLRKHSFGNIEKDKHSEIAKLGSKARTESGYKHSDKTKSKIKESNKNTNWDIRKTEEYKLMISEKTKLAMKNIDMKKNTEKSIASRQKYWNEKHKKDRELIINLIKDGCKTKDILNKLSISYPTYIKRLNEINS